LESFYDLFRDYLIVTRDILDHNLVVQVGAKDLTTYMIDGFGSSEVIPLSRWSRSLAQKKVNRKIKRFIVRYDLTKDALQ
jgi:hypothetical protein